MHRRVGIPAMPKMLYMSFLAPVAVFDDNVMASISTHPVAGVCWEWCSDGLEWTPYSPSLSAIIETAFQSGKSEVKVHVDHSSYTVSFHPTDPRQKNLATGRTRPVKRHTTEQGTASWLWWESEAQRWHAYDAVLAAQIEEAWKECNVSKTQVKEQVRAGLFFNIAHHSYALQYETDALQYNTKTQHARGVRRCSYLSQGSGSSFDGQFTTVADTNHLPCLNNALDQPHTQSGADILVGDGIWERPSYSSVELVDYLSPAATEDCSICLCSLQEKRAITLSKCEHTFHRECIESWFQSRPRCPECLMVYGTIIGTQPPGNMHIDYIKYGSKGFHSCLAGYPNVDVIKITYRFPSGIQTAQHPNPGRPYAGTVRIAYLPKNRDGEEVLELLKKAWKQRLIFRVGTSVTTGQSDVVTWSGIHHKTRTSGGSSNHGYPDENYFSRVKKELEDSGVQLVVMESFQ